MQDSSEIRCDSKGPYFVKNCKLCREDGEVIEAGESYALCRCGGTSNSPFCDGSHLKNGFDGKLDSREPGRVKSYRGEDITIHFDPYLCRHAKVCVENSPNVFKAEGRPWIVLESYDLEQLITTIKACPSGALSYTVGGVHYENYFDEDRIVLEEDGPLNLQGCITFKSENDRKELKHCSLCRCGKSKKKPYCDGSHRDR